MFRISLLVLVSSINFSITVFSQGKPVAYDLKVMYNKKQLIPVNRKLKLEREGAINVNTREGDGIIWMKGVQFTNGQIEFDVKGKDLRGQSFIGVAFHGSDSTTYELVYFRPFNFQNVERRTHSVQYSSHPNYTWDILREQFPDKYEAAIEPAPYPSNWFHVKVIMNRDHISVYVNNNNVPNLRVDSIEKHSGSMIGFWVGNGSSGDFAKPIITHID